MFLFLLFQLDIMTSSNLNINDDEENMFDGPVKRGGMGRVTVNFDKNNKVRICLV